MLLQHSYLLGVLFHPPGETTIPSCSCGFFSPPRAIEHITRPQLHLSPGELVDSELPMTSLIIIVIKKKKKIFHFVLLLDGFKAFNLFISYLNYALSFQPV